MTESSTTSWEHSIEVSFGFEKTISAFVAETTFSFGLSLGTTHGREATKEQTYSYSKSVKVPVPPGKAATVELLACIIDNQPVSFIATLRATYASG